MTGILHDLEHYRLTKRDRETLQKTSALIRNLLGLEILPGIVADLLAVFGNDVNTAMAAQRDAAEPLSMRQGIAPGILDEPGLALPRFLA